MCRCWRFKTFKTIDGNLSLCYQVALPDGRIQHVRYTAEGNYGGTTMEVTYSGEARHPDPAPHHV